MDEQIKLLLAGDVIVEVDEDIVRNALHTTVHMGVLGFEVRIELVFLKFRCRLPGGNPINEKFQMGEEAQIAPVLLVQSNLISSCPPGCRTRIIYCCSEL